MSEAFLNYQLHWLTRQLPELMHNTGRILDFGCAQGFSTAVLKQWFPLATIQGVDVDRQAIEIAKEDYPHLQFNLNHELLEKDNKPCFNLVIAMQAFHHIPCEQQVFWLQQLWRLVVPGGFLVLAELNAYNPWVKKQAATCLKQVDVELVNPWQLRSVMQEATDVAIDLKFANFFPTWSGLRFLEPLLTWMPLGQQVWGIAKKDLLK